ncbi:hypothetical protein ACFRAE_16210 [Sphingobacterium sp. HJSM2_6]|uniref:hypothetical protein n=1 Tax=Sphingobacterium sp. HJSM2_6 TaxID=3366264 RepID=UPI003BC89F7B
MNKILKLTLLIAITVIISNFSASAQLPTQHAIGARFGSATGITYRYTLSPERAVEGILSIQSNSNYSRFRLVGLYQYHKPLIDDLSWFYGFGGSVGSYTGKAHTDANGNRFDKYSQTSISIDGIVGIEYKIPSAPIAISLDAKPYFDIIQSSGFNFVDGLGFSVRYTF